MVISQKSQTLLAAFIEKVEYLNKLGFLKNPEHITGFTISKKGDGGTFKRWGPNLDERDAMINNLRPFIQDNDRVSIANLANLQGDPTISQEWKTDFQQIRSALNQHLDEERISNGYSERDVINIFFYGVSGHTNPSHKMKYDQLAYDEGSKELFEQILIEGMINIVAAVKSLANISKRELRKLNT